MFSPDRTKAVDLRKPDGKKAPCVTSRPKRDTGSKHRPHSKKGTGAVTSITASVPNSKTKVERGYKK